MAKLNEKLANKARSYCEKWRSYFKTNIDQYHDMHEFVMGQQWTQNEQDDMIKTFSKVPLISNKLATMSNSLLGEQQQNTPQLQIVPKSNCDEETASIRELITKDIMFSNESSIVYQVAASQAAVGGFGAFIVDTEYSHNKSFDLDIVYRHFKDSTRCYWDVGAEEINKTDGNFCGYVYRMTRKKFREIYGRDIESKIGESEDSINDSCLSHEENNINWSDDEGITIIDHFVRKYEKDTLYKLSNGSILNQEEMDDLIENSIRINERNKIMEIEQAISSQINQEQQVQVDQISQNQDLNKSNLYYLNDMNQQNQQLIAQQNLINSNEINNSQLEDNFMTLWQGDEIVRIEDKRPSKRHKIVRYKIAGDYELDKTEFPSQSLPIVFVDNNSYYDKNGKQICRSFFGDAKDTQRYINYLRTQSAYILKVSRYDQWIGSKKNVSSLDTQRNWTDPSNMKGMLTFDESPNGIKPEQIRPPELSQSLFQQYQLAIEDLYTSTGLYPARMGNNGDEASGKAIDARTRQGSYTTYVFFNSINRAIASGGSIVNEMIPIVYDTERVISLMMPDEGMKNIVINEQRDRYGEQIKNDIRKGTYEVVLVPGPSYEGQKEQALRSLKEVLQIDPTTFNLIADLYAENLPLSNTIEIKNRLKTKVPPEIIEAGKTGKLPQQQGPTPQQEALQVQQQQIQMNAQYQQAQIQIKQKELELKEKEMQAQIEIERMKLEIAEMEVAGGIEEQRMRYLAETDRTQSDNAISHADNLVKILTHKHQ